MQKLSIFFLGIIAGLYISYICELLWTPDICLRKYGTKELVEYCLAKNNLLK